MEATPASRFVDVLSRLGYKTQQQIADLLDIARPTAGTIVRFEKEPSFSSVAKLKQEHPEVNIEWVFSGEGEPFVTGASVPRALPSLTDTTEPTPPATGKQRFLSGDDTVEEASAIVRLARTEAENEQLRERLEDAKAEITWLRGKSTPSSYAAEPTHTPVMEIRRWQAVYGSATPKQECKVIALHHPGETTDLEAA